MKSRSSKNIFPGKTVPLTWFGVIFIVSFQLSACSYGQHQTSTAGVPANVPNGISQPANANENANAANNSTPPAHKVVNSELEKNRELWSAKKPANYNLTVTLNEGGNSGPQRRAVIEVRDGKASLVEPPDVPPIRFEPYKRHAVGTVDKMFADLRDAFDIGATVEVRYNKEYGYPEYYYINHSGTGSPPSIMADAWWELTVHKFEAIG